MIIGAGLAGLIAAYAFPRRPLMEAAPGPSMITQHKALLRFRSTSVADLTGIEFKPVTVRKAIYSDGKLVGADIQVCNLYSQKVLGKIVDRSIWNLDPVTRYIAPEDFYERLIDSVGDRIRWGSPVELSASDDKDEPIISTMPLPVILRMLRIEHGLKFESSSITVERFRVPGADIYQTIYFPDPDTNLYRASMTGDMLIMEFAGSPGFGWMGQVCRAFGFLTHDPIPLEQVDQKFGKIADVPNLERRGLIAKLTNEHNIFSLGRFATWRNILLDDVVHDASVIKRLISATQYERTLTQKG